MELLLDGLKKAFKMAASGDQELLAIFLLTLQVSITSITVSTILGLPFGMFLGLTRFPGRKALLVIINIGMGLPPVVAGLWITLPLWRSGPLGQLSSLYTPTAIVMAPKYLFHCPLPQALPVQLSRHSARICSCKSRRSEQQSGNYYSFW